MMASIDTLCREGFLAGDGRIAPLFDRIEKIADHGFVRLMGERHETGTAARSAGILHHVFGSIQERDTQVASVHARGTFRTDHHDLLGTARESGDRGDDGARRTVAKADQGGRVILGLHPVQRRRPHHRRFDRTDPHEPAKQIQRMDRLDQQHAAAIARFHAAAGFVVVRLRAPPRDGHRGGLDLTERTGLQQLLSAGGWRRETGVAA